MDTDIKEEIQSASRPWYYSVPALIGAVFAVGPFALPLLIINPYLSLKTKIWVSAVIILFTIVSIYVLAFSVNSIYEYYRLISF